MNKNVLIAILITVIVLILGASVFVVRYLFVGMLPTEGASAILKEEFDQRMDIHDGLAIGKSNFLTFELFRGGQFEIDGTSGLAWQRSDSYRDSAIIRSTDPLPKTYKVSVVVGGIDYALDRIVGLQPDSQYHQGPLNENGCYLLAITDQEPYDHYINEWWHKHRKLVIDVDNNTYGAGMPNPIFMVYFDQNNELNSYDGSRNRWSDQWEKVVSYDRKSWYISEIEKTQSEYIMRISKEDGTLLKEGRVAISDVWHTEDDFSEYFVIGDPHENFYQGSMKIKSITLEYK